MKENNLFRDVVVVADDFTGANDAGVSLTLSGKKVSVAFHTPLPSRWMHWLLIPIPVRCGQQRRPKSGRTGADIAAAHWLIKRLIPAARQCRGRNRRP